MFTELQLSQMGLTPDAYLKLSDREKLVVDQVLKEIAQGSSSSLFEELYYADYKEVPVDFVTFISDDNYLGKSTRNGQFLYPFWKNEAVKIFNDDSGAVEVALSGSIGIGKTTAACLMMAYHLYRTMCMKNPQEFFGLSPGSTIVYAFLNNTLSSSYGVGYDTVQSFLKESPWFLKHGTIAGRADPKYYPEGGFGFVVGSRPQHMLGRHVICLTGDTEIVTSQGVERIDSLVGKLIKVISYNDQGTLVSQECTVCKTGEVKELVEIELEDGTVVKCTPDHRWMLKDGTYKMAKDLSEEDELLDIN